MPTQLNGRTCKMDKIMSIAKKNGLFVVEDAAQALGSKYQGKCAGTFGLASDISFPEVLLLLKSQMFVFLRFCCFLSLRCLFS